MCVRAIIDASMFGKRDSEPMRLMLGWIKRGDGVLVYPDEGGVLRELERSSKAFALFQEFRRSGRTYRVGHDDLGKARSSVNTDFLNSNDKETIFLARASTAEVLCTDDRKLMEDFGNEELLPRVGRKRRAVYPHRSGAKTQRSFLQQRRCSRD